MRTCLSALACVLLAGDSLHAQRSPDMQWRGLQSDAARGYVRVTVRTATSSASGILRAVEADRLIFGDRAGKPMVVARSEICDVSTSHFVGTPRTRVTAMAIGTAAVVVLKHARMGKVGLLITTLGMAMAIDRNLPGPSY